MKIIRNNYYPAVLLYAFILFSMFCSFQFFDDLYKESEFLSLILIIPLLIIVYFFTRYVIKVVFQQYYFYSDRLLIKNRYFADMTIRFEDVSKVYLEKTSLNIFSYSRYYLVNVLLKDGCYYRFGPVNEQEVFLNLVLGNYRVDSSSETGIVASEDVMLGNPPYLFREGRNSISRHIYLLSLLAFCAVFFLILIFHIRDIALTFLLLSPWGMLLIYIYFFVALFYTNYLIHEDHIEIQNQILKVKKTICFSEIKKVRITTRMNFFRLTNYTYTVECIQLNMKDGKQINMLPVENMQLLYQVLRKRVAS